MSADTNGRPARTIVTEYTDRMHSIIKTNVSASPRRAVLHAIDHLQIDSYSAKAATVYDRETGALHAVITNSVTRKIEILYKRSPREYI